MPSHGLGPQLIVIRLLSLNSLYRPTSYAAGNVVSSDGEVNRVKASFADKLPCPQADPP